jgi:hypothetical protein
MGGSPKEKLQTQSQTGTEEVEGEREVFLRDGKKLVVSDQGNDQVVEIRNESGLLELRIKLTEQGPVLQMESVRLQLKAAEAVEIEAKRVELKGTEQVAIDGGNVKVTGEQDVNVDAKGEVRVVGKMIYLN